MRSIKRFEGRKKCIVEKHVKILHQWMQRHLGFVKFGTKELARDISRS